MVWWHGEDNTRERKTKQHHFCKLKYLANLVREKTKHLKRLLNNATVCVVERKENAQLLNRKFAIHVKTNNKKTHTFDDRGDCFTKT